MGNLGLEYRINSMFLGLSGGVYSIMSFVQGEMSTTWCLAYFAACGSGLNVETVAENGNLFLHWAVF